MMPLLRDWDFDALITHNRFTLANRNAEEMLDLAQAKGIAVLNAAPYAGGILAIELLAAAEGIEFHRPLGSSPPLEAAHARIRAVVPRFERDRFFAPAIAAAHALVAARAFETLLPGLRLPSAIA